MSAGVPGPGATEPRGCVLVTGASGSLGRRTVPALVAPGRTVIAADLALPEERIDGVDYVVLDVCKGDLEAVFAARGVETVVHLAALVSPRPGQGEEEQRLVDVEGTRRVVAACLAASVRRLVYTSSGAAYGYHADNPALLDEGDALRGNDAFAYSRHKRQVEELLAEARAGHPELEQVVFRVCTILGAAIHNQITAMFDRPVVLGLRGAATPFCFAWDEDVAACLVRGVQGGPAGVYNVAGDGAMTLREIAAALGKPFLAMPEGLLRRALGALHPRGLVPYGPEQILFLKYRPVLGNRRLKEDFGLRPTKTSRQAFEAFAAARALG